MRDKYVFVQEAPWKVFDQVELFIHSTNVALTWIFYSKIAQFFIISSITKDSESINMEEEKLIKQLIPNYKTQVSMTDEEEEKEEF